MDASRDRLKAMSGARQCREIPFRPGFCQARQLGTFGGYEQTLALMNLKDPPTAIFCANDLMALGCYEALKELGERIPDDVAVIGYDDREIAQFTRPPLTTILLPIFEMGTLAADTLSTTRAGLRAAAQIKVECPLVNRIRWARAGGGGEASHSLAQHADWRPTCCFW